LGTFFTKLKRNMKGSKNQQHKMADLNLFLKKVGFYLAMTQNSDDLAGPHCQFSPKNAFDSEEESAVDGFFQGQCSRVNFPVIMINQLTKNQWVLREDFDQTNDFLVYLIKDSSAQDKTKFHQIKFLIQNKDNNILDRPKLLIQFNAAECS
jgi:hypothetical protein